MGHNGKSNTIAFDSGLFDMVGRTTWWSGSSKQIESSKWRKIQNKIIELTRWATWWLYIAFHIQ